MTLDAVERQLRKKADKAFASPQHVKSNERMIASDHKGYFSALAGVYMSEDEYKHTNMVPNFGSNFRQNMSPNANNAIMETFTGVGETFIDKQEATQLFQQQKELTNINGQKSSVEFEQSRFNKPTVQNNIFPLAQIRVGPGLGLGYTASPSGGFRQSSTLNAIKPKTIDELRVSSKQQVTYSAPAVPGSAYVKGRGALPSIAKQRPETSAEIPFNYQVASKAQVNKEAKYGFFHVPFTDRENEQDYIAPAMSKDKGTMLPSDVRDPIRKAVVENDTLGPAMNTHHGNLGDDYGHDAIDLPITTK
eukprot:gene19652-26338_t